jgi:predicted ribosomally synthesized peptide with nif11-like leader
MSVESARSFLEQALQDEELLDRIANAPPGQRSKIAREAGYDFNPQELREAREQLSAGGSESDDATSARVPTLLYGVVDDW